MAKGITRNDIAKFTKDVYLKNYYTVNKHLIKLIGVEAAFFLDVLIKRQQLVQQFYPFGWFYFTGDAILKETGISKKVQTRIFEELETKGFIKTKLHGMPAYRHIKINYQQLIDVMPQKEEELVKKQHTVHGDSEYDYDSSMIIDFDKFNVDQTEN